MSANRRAFLASLRPRPDASASPDPTGQAGDGLVKRIAKVTRRTFGMAALSTLTACAKRENVERWTREDPPAGPEGEAKKWTAEAHAQGYRIEVLNVSGAMDSASEYRYHRVAWRKGDGAYPIPATLTDTHISQFMRNSETVRDSVIVNRYEWLDTAEYISGIGLHAQATRLWETDKASIDCRVDRNENVIELRLPPSFDALEGRYRRKVQMQEEGRGRLEKLPKIMR